MSERNQMPFEMLIKVTENQNYKDMLKNKMPFKKR